MAITGIKLNCLLTLIVKQCKNFNFKFWLQLKSVLMILSTKSRWRDEIIGLPLLWCSWQFVIVSEKAWAGDRFYSIFKLLSQLLEFLLWLQIMGPRNALVGFSWSWLLCKRQFCYIKILKKNVSFYFKEMTTFLF